MLMPEVTKSCRDFDPEFKRVPIRSDYKEAEGFALSACGDMIPPRVLLVIGRPGTSLSLFYSAATGSRDFLPGKSVFLLHILLCRLALRLLTALQIEPNWAPLFYKNGVKEFARLDDEPAYNPLTSGDGPLCRI